MFLRHFGLRQHPFDVTPDPRFFYASVSHQKALASVINSIECGCGFSTLVGEPGLGKTTLLYALLKRYSDQSRTAFVSSGRGEDRDLIPHILADFEVETTGTNVNAMYCAFSGMLDAEGRAGRWVILFLDEAHAFSTDALDMVRLLSNFEAPGSRPLHVVLAGQSEMGDTLRHPDLASLQQRITTRARLRRLTPAEVAEYIEYRLQTAGAESTDSFTPEAVDIIAEESRGVPREINRLSANAMTLACELQLSQVDEEVVREIIHALDPEEAREPQQPRNARVIPMPDAPSVRERSNSISTYTWGSQALAFSPAREEQRESELKPVEAPLERPAPSHDVNDPLVALRAELRAEPLVSEHANPSRQRFVTAAVVIVVAILMGGLGMLERNSRRSGHAVSSASAPAPSPATQVTTARQPLVIPRRKAGRKRSANSAILHPPLSVRTKDEGESSPPTLSQTSDPSGIQPLIPPPMPGPSVPADKQTTPSAPLNASAAPNGSTSRPTMSVASATVPASAAPRVTPAVVRSRVQPVYPASAKAQHVEGTVRMQVHLDNAGHVIGVTVLSGDPRLAASAQDAVRKWVFSPVLQDGNPIDGYTQVNVKFTPTH